MMTDNIKLVHPTCEYRAQIQDFWNTAEIDPFIGSGLVGVPLDNVTVDEWLEICRKSWENGDQEPYGLIHSKQFIAIRESDNKIVGAINIRQEKCPGGHIGYSVAPDERGKGYATQILSLALDECRQMELDSVTMICSLNNIGSNKVIQKNGGVLEEEYATSHEGVLRRYVIECVKRNCQPSKSFETRKKK